MESLAGMKGDIILRKSRMVDETLDQIFHVHRPRLIDLATKYGVEYDIIEDIVSGTQSMEADALFGRVMQKTERGQSKVWICMDVDRLARPDPEEAGKILNCVKRNEVFILTPDHIYSPHSYDDGIFLATKLWIAKIEHTMYMKRTAATHEHIYKKESRYANGCSPFGYLYVSETKSYVIDPATYPIVEYAYQLIRRYGYNTVFNKIKEKFGPSVISWRQTWTMFKNPFYAGYPVRRWNGSRLFDQTKWIWPDQPAAYETPVTLEEWKEIQEIISSRDREKPKTTADTWARGVLRCAVNDRRYVGQNVTYTTVFIGYPTESGRYSIQKQRVHRVIEFILEQIFSDKIVLQDVIRAAESKLREGDRSRDVQLDELAFLKTAIGKKEAQLKKLIAAYAEADDMRAVARKIFENQVQERSDELESLTQRFQELSGAITVPFASTDMLEVLNSVPADFFDWWPECDPATKMAIVNLLIEEVTVDKLAIDPSKSIKATRWAITDVRFRFPIEVVIPPPLLQSDMSLRVGKYILLSIKEGRGIPTPREVREAMNTTDKYVHSRRTHWIEYLKLS